MVKKSWIVIGLCIAVAVMLSAVVYAEKGEKECSLSAAAQAAVKALFPNAMIEKSEMEEKEVKVCEVKVKDGNKESEVKLTGDGTVMEVESIEAVDTVPATVAQTIKAQNAEVKKVEKEVEYAQLKVVKLDTPVTSYEAEIIKDGKEIEIEIAADGTILKQEVEKKKDKDEKREEHEKDKD
ncbi:MAG: hypothetical protein ABSE89_11625 [Sedimentisphaerales bacterium]